VGGGLTLLVECEQIWLERCREMRRGEKEKKQELWERRHEMPVRTSFIKKKLPKQDQMPSPAPRHPTRLGSRLSGGTEGQEKK